MVKYSKKIYKKKQSYKYLKNISKQWYITKFSTTYNKLTCTLLKTEFYAYKYIQKRKISLIYNIFQIHMHMLILLQHCQSYYPRGKDGLMVHGLLWIMCWKIKGELRNLRITVGRNFGFILIWFMLKSWNMFLILLLLCFLLRCI